MKVIAWLVGAFLCLGVSAAPDSAEKVPTTTETAPKVELLDAGKQPRRELRLTFKSGDTFERVMSMRMGVRMVVHGEEQPPGPVPTISMAMSGKIDSVEMNGNARYHAILGEMTIEGEDLPPESAAMLRAYLADVVGTRVSALISPRGIQSEGSIETKSLNPQVLTMFDSLKQSFSQMSVPFPLEAIGVEGRWAVTTEMKMNGLPLRQRMVYRVASMSDKFVTLTAKVEQTLATPDAKMENLPAGVEGVARSMSGEMSGRITMALDQVMPRRSTVSGTSKAEMEMTAAGQKMPMSATYDMHMRLHSPGDAEPIPDEHE